MFNKIIKNCIFINAYDQIYEDSYYASDIDEEIIYIAEVSLPNKKIITIKSDYPDWLDEKGCFDYMSKCVIDRKLTLFGYKYSFISYE